LAISHKTLKRHIDVEETLLSNIISKEVRKEGRKQAEDEKIKITCGSLLVLTMAV
jgi:hemerythrin-like domain-containing protein